MTTVVPAIMGSANASHPRGGNPKPALPRAVGPNVVPAQPAPDADPGAGTQEGRRGRASRRSGAGRRRLLSLLPSREKARLRGHRTSTPYRISNSTCTLIRSSSSPPLIDVAGALAARDSAKDSAYTFAMGAPAAPSLINVGSPRLTPARLAK